VQQTFSGGGAFFTLAGFWAILVEIAFFQEVWTAVEVWR
jgi:hypothetical protein